ncbi:hypothetical protein M977_03692 [Buttiauxella gaviniae ATCC 51604]|uniref:Uncharacterized protein n=1 Tax=Buttiauxella gaviniae ATCC 51604 TaxID=1354253 RepID=A0A1B7HR98_9ENTR|nr:hypothetical protein [Buttiauxella gaviniae]MRT15186.1 hypothetical protein [Enterobacteriaceae bacterium RIT711]OAT18171.1 hypothetical protein M977_03692 [Buttiauxella gaviniae ATCC 51604]
MKNKSSRVTQLHATNKKNSLSPKCISKLNRVMGVSEFMHSDLHGASEVKLHSTLVADIFSYISEDMIFICEEMDERGLLERPADSQDS